MKFTMIDYTAKGEGANHAADLLRFAKNTRLLGTGALNKWAIDDGDRETEIAYIARTIPSSWEFIHYTFLLEGVSRGFTHQLVRTRVASFAQQTMRMVDVGDFDYYTPPAIAAEPFSRDVYDDIMIRISRAYRELIMKGIKPEDARGVLPTNICTNILAGMNLRTIVELVRKRSSPRVQGEYREFVAKLQEGVQNVHPWTFEFFHLDWAALNEELEAELSVLPREQATRIAKLFSKVTEGVS